MVTYVELEDGTGGFSEMFLMEIAWNRMFYFDRKNQLASIPIGCNGSDLSPWLVVADVNYDFRSFLH